MLSLKIVSGLKGEINIPGDKSISHRSIIIPSISKGICEISNILKSEDVMHTLKAFQLMGVKIEEMKNKIIIYGRGLNSLQKPNREIQLGNSGTSARLLTGLLSAQKFNTTLLGDKSLMARPMKRITDPLKLMNAKITTSNGCLPIKIYGSELKNIEITINIPSAQIKSGIILATLFVKGKSTIYEINTTRNHTEIMLESFGADIDISKANDRTKIIVIGKKELLAKNIEVPADLSSSAFFIVAALINKNSNIKLKNININPTRKGILTALEKMGANINITNNRFINKEPVADIFVKSSKLHGCELDEKFAKLMIDEYPILSIAAACANSPSMFKGLGELRLKESNRLELIKTNLIRCGCYCEINGDDLFIDPLNKTKVNKKNIKTDFDHRIAMAFAVMGSKIGNLSIEDPESIKTSFPTFVNEFNKAGGNIIEK